jgi:hypothetical protein
MPSPQSPLTAFRIAFATMMIAHASATHAQFTPQDEEVCPAAAGVVDPEFYSAGRRMVFMDRSNRLKVVALRSDGSLGPGGCRGTVIDERATLSVPGFPLINGGEWALSQRGAEIYYTRLDGSGRVEMAWARENGGSWDVQIVEASSDRGLPIPSMDGSDPQARILYARSRDGGYELMWRESTDPTTERAFGAHVVQASGGAPRWVRGERAITTTQLDAYGVAQAVRIDIDTTVVDVLTQDTDPTDEVWMWRAPEFGAARVFIAVARGSQLRVYREEGATWNLINVLDAAAFSARSGIYSPEPTIIDGRSYVVMQLSNQKVGPSEIWIASIDPALPLLRQVSDPTETHKVPTEPEWVHTSDGSFIYYSLNEGRGRASLRRARTGL